MDLTPEMELILAALRWFAGNGSGSELNECAHAISDWTAVLDLAGAHGIDPLIAWCLQNDGANLLPAEVLARLRGILRDNSAKHLMLSAEMLRILRLFGWHGITSIPLKGPVLASMLCEDIAWRTTSDIDLLVRPADITRAKEVVSDAGYRFGSHLPWAQETVAMHWNSQLTFIRETDGAHLDLHWRLLPAGFPCADWFDSIWDRLVPASFEAELISGLGAEDLLLYLCAHGAKHSWQSLAPIADVARLLAVRHDLNWDRLMTDCRQCGGEIVLALGLWLASRLTGARLPRAVAHGIDTILDNKAFAPIVMERLLTNSPEKYETNSEFWLQVRLASGWRSKLRYSAAHVFLPTEADGESLNLPRSLFFLYYPYRQARLALKYVARRS